MTTRVGPSSALDTLDTFPKLLLHHAKARGDRARALAFFEQLAQEVNDASVRLELAKLYEHYMKQPMRALSLLAEGIAESSADAAKRRARLELKASRPTGR